MVNNRCFSIEIVKSRSFRWIRTNKICLETLEIRLAPREKLFLVSDVWSGGEISSIMQVYFLRIRTLDVY